MVGPRKIGRNSLCRNTLPPQHISIAETPPVAHNGSTMNSVNSYDSIAPLPRNALRHEVAVRLMSLIFQGTLPPGEHLVIRKMAEQMGVSATPVREALVELESIGIVQFSHHRGVIVKPFGFKEFRDIFHLRRLLETEAARCACGHIPREELETMAKEAKELLTPGLDRNNEWFQKAMATDRHLHEQIAACCGNPRLANEISRYNGLIQTVREIVGNHPQTHRSALKEHVPIIDALLANDPERSAVAMTEHINGTLQSIEEVLFGKK